MWECFKDTFSQERQGKLSKKLQMEKRRDNENDQKYIRHINTPQRCEKNRICMQKAKQAPSLLHNAFIFRNKY